MLPYAAERGVPALVFPVVHREDAARFAAARRQPNFVLYGRSVMIAVLSAGWYEFNLGTEIITLFLAVMAWYTAVAPEDARITVARKEY